MYVSWRWLSRWVDTAGVDPADFAARFTLAVAEIEQVVTFGRGLGAVQVADVIAVSAHPDASRLQVVTVDLGGRAVDVVCGAPHVAVGQRVPFVPPGVTLPSGIEVREGMIRGVRSPGMLASERDLGLADAHEGLLVLDGCLAPAGTALPEALALEDTLYEVDNKSITHRPDLWGMHGIAREIAALLDRPLRPLRDTDHAILGAGPPLAHLAVDAGDLCSRYLCARIEGVRVGSSPVDLRLRLRSVGVRPVSNVVDATNQVMLETGNPLHAFDARSLRGDTIVVRRADEGELIRTLDDSERALDTRDCVIADSAGPVALAGVMGGADSEIRDDTQTVVLEAAHFDAATIRRTSLRLGLRTESSARFEKGLDPYGTESAALRFLDVVCQLCPGARVASALADAGPHHEAPPAPLRIATRGSYLRSRLGVSEAELDDSWMDGRLSALEFDVARDGDALVVTVPSFRATGDVGIPEDLVEELGRHYGYDRIRSETPSIVAKPPYAPPLRRLERDLREQCAFEAGLCEVLLYSFESEAARARLGLIERGADGESLDRLPLANPISSDLPMLRRNLAPNLIVAMERALAQGNREEESRKGLSVGLFEIGRVFLPPFERVHRADQLGSLDWGKPAVLRMTSDEPERMAYEGMLVGDLAVGARTAADHALPLPLQPVRLAICLGERLGGGAEGGAGPVAPPPEVSRRLFREAVGMIEGIATRLGLAPPTVRRAAASGRIAASDRRPVDGVDLAPTWLHPARHGLVRSGDDLIGIVTTLHPAVRGALEVPAEVVLVELDLAALMGATATLARGDAPPRFPASTFDVTIDASVRTRAADVRQQLASLLDTDAGWTADVRLIGVYETADLPDRRALTWRFTVRRADRTLTDDEIRAAQAAVAGLADSGLASPTAR